MTGVGVDQGGNINIVYYAAFLSGTQWMYQVKYARVSAFTSPYPSPAVATIALSAPFPLDDIASQLPTRGNCVLMGDYVMGAARGCEFYAGYVARAIIQQNPVVYGSLGTFVSKITTMSTCARSADMDQDGQINGADAAIFVQCYASGDPRADLTNDTSVNAADAMYFGQAYACGCTPP